MFKRPRMEMTAAAVAGAVMKEMVIEGFGSSDGRKNELLGAYRCVQQMLIWVWKPVITNYLRFGEDF